jgi:hypothetical protein
MWRSTHDSSTSAETSDQAAPISWLAPPRSDSRTRTLSKIDRAKVPRGSALDR